jgi:hypothetical protein
MRQPTENNSPHCEIVEEVESLIGVRDALRVTIKESNEAVITHHQSREDILS